MSDTLDKIRTRGFWEVVIRPSEFMDNKIPDISDLFPIIRKCSVIIRGWDFPHIDNKKPLFDKNRISQSFESGEYLEEWVFFQSGQFVHYCGFYNDWASKNPYKSKLITSESGLDFIETLIRFIEIYELAARISMTEAGSEKMVVYTNLHGLKGRKLFTSNPGRLMQRPYITDMSEFPKSYDLSMEELVSNTQLHALNAARELFTHFGWKVTIDDLVRIVDSLPFLQNIEH
jgi:hypothetical protein